MKPERITIALAGDVIFTPYTDGTQYACRRDAKANLERRMPGWSASISDVTGEGQVSFSVNGQVDIEGVTATIVASGIASPLEMAVHSVRIERANEQYDIDPVDKARSPEDTLRFLTQLAQNCGKA